jgi:hypothetical protein
VGSVSGRPSVTRTDVSADLVVLRPRAILKLEAGFSSFSALGLLVSCFVLSLGV